MAKRPKHDQKVDSRDEVVEAAPECPAAGTVTYSLEVSNEEFLVTCRGHNHLPVSVPADCPRYHRTAGLVER